MDFWREFLTVGRQGKYFLFSIWFSICRNRTCKNFEIVKKLTFLSPKRILNRDFALDGGGGGGGGGGGKIIHVNW